MPNRGNVAADEHLDARGCGGSRRWDTALDAAADVADELGRVPVDTNCRLLGVPQTQKKVVKKALPVYSGRNSTHRIAAQTGANGGRSP